MRQGFVDQAFCPELEGTCGLPRQRIHRCRHGQRNSSIYPLIGLQNHEPGRSIDSSNQAPKDFHGR
jgi:hypothetical protein